ncbi:MAG: TetR/AcrR family transcriptional regulator [Candidatus Omnitrophica bacterium]|nr:TetR/AcrR family transcriptional regulator [Candidatus Omnitrophota bacterium]
MNANSLIEERFIKDNPRVLLNRRQRDKLLRKNDILRAAEHVFALKGYYEATMQDIAKEAQYATGTVYLYFKDKDALYLSLVEQKYKDLLTILKEETAKAQSAKEKLAVFIQENLSFFERNQNSFRIFFNERNKSRTIRVGKLHNLPVVLQHREFVMDLIKSSQEENLVKDDFPAKQIADIFISVLMSVVFNWLRDETKSTKNLSRMSGFVLEMFLNGAGKHK